MDNEESTNLINSLLEKSEEAYLMSLEIINKPTIKYRTEGFCFFICNAWELLLKAYIIRNKGMEAIKYKDKSNRTIGLDDCVVKVFTSEDNPVRNNLFFIKRIRNTATHLVMPNIDFKFSSVFQRCLYNYNNFFAKQFPDYRLNENVTPFISLAKVKNEDDSYLILDKTHKKELEELIRDMDNDESLSLNLKLTSVKKASDADLTYRISSDAEESARLITVPKDTNKLYPYSATNCIAKIQETVAIELGSDVKFNMSHFTRICKEKDLYNNQTYCYKTQYGTNIIKKYSDDAIEYISSIYINDVKNCGKKQTI